MEASKIIVETSSPEKFLTHPKRRRSDIVGKESHPYGQTGAAGTPSSLPPKDSMADELSWRNGGVWLDPKTDRRKAHKKKAQSAGQSKPPITPIKKNRKGPQVGYDPYESGQLVKKSNPGVRRSLRDLGIWLKTQVRPEHSDIRATPKKSPKP